MFRRLSLLCHHDFSTTLFHFSLLLRHCPVFGHMSLILLEAVFLIPISGSILVKFFSQPFVPPVPCSFTPQDVTPSFLLPTQGTSLGQCFPSSLSVPRYTSSTASCYTNTNMCIMNAKVLWHIPARNNFSTNERRPLASRDFPWHTFLLASSVTAAQPVPWLRLEEPAARCEG